MAVQLKVNAIAYALMIRCLVEGGYSIHDLREATGLAASTMRQHLKQLRKNKLVYVSGWEEDTLGREVTALYSFGDKKDVPKRGRQTNAQRSAKRKAARLALKEVNLLSDNHKPDGRRKPSAAINCVKCHVPMKLGMAPVPVLSGAPDFPGDAHATTLSQSGKAVMSSCMKCPSCGHSVSIG